jgi:class 3 adenylate cyclase
MPERCDSSRELWFRCAVPPARASVRPAIWLLHIALPLLGLWVLVVNVRADSALIWKQPPSHFWIVLGTAVISCALAIKAATEARGAHDARLFLAACSFLLAAGFLGLHALGTPGVLLDVPNAGFVLGTPVGLAIASVPAAASAVMIGRRGEAVMRHSALLLGLILLIFVAWAAFSLLQWPPFDGHPTVEQHRGTFAVVAIPAAILYLGAALVYYLQYRRRPSVVLLSVLTAFVLLAEALLATLVGRNWHASWWTWHLLMTAAFALVAYAALIEFSREGSTRRLFRGVFADGTIHALRRDYAAALDQLVSAVETGRRESVDQLAAGLADRFALSDSQVQLLAQAADALGHERQRIRRLDALVDIGQEVSVIRNEREFVASATEHLRRGFAPDEIRIELDGNASEPEDEGTLVAPLMLKGSHCGRVVVTRAGEQMGEHDRAEIDALASELSIALENTRLYHELDRLFRQYLSPDVAAALLADPSQAALGGEIREVTVLFGDLVGFTPFSERRAPTEVVTMLNQYFGIAVPIMLAEGGTVLQFIGDAMMVVFNAPMHQDDHAQRAVRGALAVCEAIDRERAEHDGWPRMRIGVNSGPALIGNIGGDEVRAFTAIGDTINLAARLEPLAPPGGVIVGAHTRELLGDDFDVRALDPVTVKGKGEVVQPFVVTR